jgi:YesN/AraC family two-component response regulator
MFGERYRVLEAADGEEGLALAQQHQPDLVLSDVMMPKMDGVALCRALKADDALRTIPVVLLTAKAAEADAVEGLEAGADAYVAKPFGTAVLQAHVASLLAARQQMRTQFSQEVVVKPTDVVVDSEEEAFLKDVLAIVEDNMADSTFGVDQLAEQVGLSRRQLERRLKDTTGQTPAELIRQMRLERASQLLEARAGTVSEIAYAVGYKSPSYFSTAFREAFGHAPSEHFDTAS